MKVEFTDKVKCTCCGGLCPWHAEHGPKAENNRSYACDCSAGPRPDILEPGYLTHKHAATCASEWTVPGCWECCGSGCRACGSTGYRNKPMAGKRSDGGVHTWMVCEFCGAHVRASRHSSEDCDTIYTLKHGGFEMPACKCSDEFVALGNCFPLAAVRCRAKASQ